MGRFNLPKDKNELSAEEILEAIRNNDGSNSDYSVEYLDGVSGDDIMSAQEANDIIINLPVNESPVFLISKPEIITPLNSVLGVIDNTIVANSFVAINNYEGIHTASDWEAALDPDFNTIVDYSHDDTENLITWSAEKLTNQTVYYVRVRYISDYHTSEWSDIIKFTTGNMVSIETPIVSVTGAPNLVPLRPLITGSSFIPLGGYEEHISTDWEVLDENGNLLWESIDDSNNLRYMTLPPNLLEYNKQYTFRIRYNGKNLSSQWGEILSATHPEPYMIDPEISVAGAPDNINTAPVLHGSPFLIKYDTDTHIATDWVVEELDGTIIVNETRTGGDLTYFVVPANHLVVGRSYVFKMRYRGIVYTGNWVSATEQVNLAISIETPVITVDTFGSNDAELVTIQPLLESTPFNVLNSSDNHVSTDWEIYATNNLTIPVWTSLNDTNNLTSIVLPDHLLEYNTPYVFKVRYNSTNYISDYGKVTKVTRQKPRALAPVVLSPTDGDIDVPMDPFLTVVDNLGSIIMYNDPNTALDDLDSGVLDKIIYTFTTIAGESVGHTTPFTVEKTSFSETLGANLTMGSEYRLDCHIEGTVSVPGTVETLVSPITTINFKVNFDVIVNTPNLTITVDGGGFNSAGNGFNAVEAMGTPYSDNTSGQAKFNKSTWILYDEDDITTLSSRAYTRTATTDPETTHTFTGIDLKPGSQYKAVLYYEGFLNNSSFVSDVAETIVNTGIPTIATPTVNISGDVNNADADNITVVTNTANPGIITNNLTHTKTEVEIRDNTDVLIVSNTVITGNLITIDMLDLNLNFSEDYVIRVRHTMSYTNITGTHEIASDWGTLNITIQDQPVLTGVIKNADLDTSPFNVTINTDSPELSDMTDVASVTHTKTTFEILYKLENDVVFTSFVNNIHNDPTGTDSELTGYEFDIVTLDQPPFNEESITVLGPNAIYTSTAQLYYRPDATYQFKIIQELTVTFNNNSTSIITAEKDINFAGETRPYITKGDKPVLSIDQNNKVQIDIPAQPQPAYFGRTDVYTEPHWLKYRIYTLDSNGNESTQIHPYPVLGFEYIDLTSLPNLFTSQITIELNNTDINISNLPPDTEYVVEIFLYRTIYYPDGSLIVNLELNPNSPLKSDSVIKNPPYQINNFNVIVTQELGDDTNDPYRVEATIDPYGDNKDGSDVVNVTLSIEINNGWGSIGNETIPINNPSNDISHNVSILTNNPTSGSIYRLIATYQGTYTGVSPQVTTSKTATDNAGSITAYSVDNPTITVTQSLSNSNTTTLTFNVTSFIDNESNSGYENTSKVELLRDSSIVATKTLPQAGLTDETFAPGDLTPPETNFPNGSYSIKATYDGKSPTTNQTDSGEDTASAGSISAIAPTWESGGVIKEYNLDVPLDTNTPPTTKSDKYRAGIELYHKGSDIGANAIIAGGSNKNDTVGGYIPTSATFAGTVNNNQIAFSVGYVSNFENTGNITLSRHNMAGKPGTSHVYLFGGMDDMGEPDGTSGISRTSDRIYRWPGEGSSPDHWDKIKSGTVDLALNPARFGAIAAFVGTDPNNYNYFVVSGGGYIDANNSVQDTNQQVLVKIKDGGITDPGNDIIDIDTSNPNNDNLYASLRNPVVFSTTFVRGGDSPPFGGDKTYFFGGVSNNNNIDTAIRKLNFNNDFNNPSVTWSAVTLGSGSEIPNDVIRPAGYTTYYSSAGKYYGIIVGGRNSSGVYSPNIYVFDFQTETWSLGPDSPLEIPDLTSTIVGEKRIILPVTAFRTSNYKRLVIAGGMNFNNGTNPILDTIHYVDLAE
jgi:hypothetical protein